MPTCLECGKSLPRLQWTHFRYNCTGKFLTGKDYMKAYPGSRIVDEDIAKKTGVTKDNLVAKYGTIVGESRWEQYREKQARSNSFEYKKEKYGWSLDQFNEYNSSRAQTLEKMIDRYGEEDGINRWEAYCERQSYTKTLNYLIEKYGESEGRKKYLEINKKKATSNPFILSEKLNITVDEAVDLILKRQTFFFSSNLEKEFVFMLESITGTLEYTSFSRPFGKWSHDLETYVIYDIKHKNSIVEFNGDYWHANPKIYTESTVIRGRTAKDIWHRDMLKLKTAEDLGYRTLTVWESEFRSNKRTTVEEVAKWILNERK